MYYPGYSQNSLHISNSVAWNEAGYRLYKAGELYQRFGAQRQTWSQPCIWHLESCFLLSSTMKLPESNTKKKKFSNYSGNAIYYSTELIFIKTQFNGLEEASMILSFVK